jgi:hypothetical protein
MNTPNDDRQFEDKARRLFNESVEQLDAATLSRLNRSRHEALAELKRPGTARAWLRVAPVAGVAAAAVFAVMLVMQPSVDNAIEMPSIATDFEILMDESSFEMIEDLEFFVLMEGLEENGNVS